MQKILDKLKGIDLWTRHTDTTRVLAHQLVYFKDSVVKNEFLNLESQGTTGLLGLTNLYSSDA